MRYLNFILVFGLVISSIYSFAQDNLILNGDFEQGPNNSTDVNGWGGSNGPDLWIQTKGTPDRIYLGDSAEFRDNDTAFSGLAYVIFYGKYPNQEAGKSLLSKPLKIGNTYRLTYHLDIDTNFYEGAAGVIFLFNEGGDSIVSPVQTDLDNWKRFDTSFVASGNSTELEIKGNGNALVKIDSISLVDDSLSVVSSLLHAFGETFIYPNPLRGSFYVKSLYPEIKFKVYNCLGEKINATIKILNDKVHVDMSNFPSGVYIITFYNHKILFSKKIILY